MEMWIRYSEAYSRLISNGKRVCPYVDNIIIKLYLSGKSRSYLVPIHTCLLKIKLTFWIYYFSKILEGVNTFVVWIRILILRMYVDISIYSILMYPSEGSRIECYMVDFTCEKGNEYILTFLFGICSILPFQIYMCSLVSIYVCILAYESFTWSASSFDGGRRIPYKSQRNWVEGWVIYQSLKFNRMLNEGENVVLDLFPMLLIEVWNVPFCSMNVWVYYILCKWYYICLCVTSPSWNRQSKPSW